MSKYYYHRKKKKKKKIYGKDILTVLLILFIGIFIGLMLNLGTPELVTGPGQVPDIEPLSLSGYVPVNVTVEPNIMVLGTECYRFEMVTTSAQIASIEAGLKGARGFRPLTHDLISDIIETFKMNVIMVRIESLVEGTYFAKIFILQGNKVLSLDSKPSDALAIAARTGSLVYVNQDLLESEGTYLC